MIHYHGLPITPDSAAYKAVEAGHAFVSFAHSGQLGIAVEVAQSFALDNGAFSAWKSGNPVTDWSEYYEWVGRVRRIPSFDWAVIPDVIDGTEKDNDALCGEWPYGRDGVPVWHMHESVQRLSVLCEKWGRVCLGSSGTYATVGTPQWWDRMSEAMDAICDRDGRPMAKLHGLRMLNVDVFTKLPLASADSTNIGRNIGIDKRWKGTYSPPTKEMRAMLIRSRIESMNAPDRWIKPEASEQLALFDL